MSPRSLKEIERVRSRGGHRVSARRPDLSLVFPVFDEEESLGPLLDAALALAPRLAADHEIVVVDDGSRDASAAVVADYCRRHPSVRLLRHAANRGYGAALRAGLREARGELVFFSDADLQFDLAQLSELLNHARDFDIVAGYREPRRDPWGRRSLAWAWGEESMGIVKLQQTSWSSSKCIEFSGNDWMIESSLFAQQLE